MTIVNTVDIGIDFRISDLEMSEIPVCSFRYLDVYIIKTQYSLDHLTVTMKVLFIIGRSGVMVGTVLLSLSQEQRLIFG